jgi:hypothetical protein
VEALSALRSGGRARAAAWSNAGVRVPAYASSKPTASARLPRRRGRMLLSRRGHRAVRGKWDFPGGFLDEEEHPRTACAASLREEAGRRDRAARASRRLDGPLRRRRLRRATRSTSTRPAPDRSAGTPSPTRRSSGESQMVRCTTDTSRTADLAFPAHRRGQSKPCRVSIDVYPPERSLRDTHREDPTPPAYAAGNVLEHPS